MENLKSYLDGELDIAQKAEVETHLRNDAELQKMVEEFSAISTTLKTADSGEPYGFEKLEERLKEVPKVSIIEKKKIWRTAINWSFGGICVIVLGAILFPVFAQAKSAAKMTAGMTASRFGDEISGDATVSSAKASPIGSKAGGQSHDGFAADAPQSNGNQVETKELSDVSKHRYPRCAE
jgi:anti-sigma factor RsiW